MCQSVMGQAAAGVRGRAVERVKGECLMFGHML